MATSPTKSNGKRSLSEDPPAADQPTWTEADDLGPTPDKKPRMATPEEVAAKLAEARAANHAASVANDPAYRTLAADAAAAIEGASVPNMPGHMVDDLAHRDTNTSPTPRMAFKVSVGEKELPNDRPGKNFKALVTFSEEYVAAELAKNPSVHVAVMTDVSYSMQGRGINAAKEAIKKIPEQLLTDAKVQPLVSLNTFHGSAQEWRPENCDIAPADLNAKCLDYADKLHIPGNSNGTNHSDALKSCVNYLKDKQGLKHVVFITDGDSTVGECNPMRQRQALEQMLKDLAGPYDTQQEIVVHCVVVGTCVNREVPKNLCAPTGGIVACALRMDTLPDEMARVFGPIREAPRALVLITDWYDRPSSPETTRHGLLTSNKRHVLLDLGWACSNPQLGLAHLDVSVHGHDVRRDFDLVPNVDLAEVVVPEDLKFELEAIELEKKMAAEAEEALKTKGYDAMVDVVRHTTASAPVVGMPVYIQERFTRRAVATETMASVAAAMPVDEDDEGEGGPSYRSLGGGPALQRQPGMDANSASIRMQSMMSQSDY